MRDLLESVQRDLPTKGVPSSPCGLDLRYPIGLLFGVVGGLLTGHGILFPDLRAPLTPFNLDLYAGLAMLAFGISMILLAARASRRI